MDKIRTLLFIPEDVSFLKSIDDIDVFANPQVAIKEKIKSNPFDRERIRREARKRGILANKNPVASSNSNPTTNRVVPDIEPEIDDGEKNFIKNMTPHPIIIVTNEVHESGKLKGHNKAIEIRHFLDKRSLSESDLNHPELQSLYDAGKITDVSKAERDKGMKRVWQSQQSIIEARERQIDAYGGVESPEGGKISSGVVSRVSDNNSDNMSERAKSGALYTEETENTININPNVRGKGLESMFSDMESALGDGDAPMSDAEMKKFMGNY